MDPQKIVFDWAAAQPAFTGLVIFAAGFVYGFCGYRMIRYLLVVPSAAIGALAGWLVSVWLPNLPPLMLAAFSGLIGAALAVAFPRALIAVNCALTFGGLAAYLFGLGGASNLVALIVLGLVGLIALIVALLSRHAMAILFTTFQGVSLIVVGFVCMATNILPTLGATFRALAHNQAFTVPVLLLMLSVTAYSYQASSRQGDMFTGMGAPPAV